MNDYLMTPEEKAQLDELTVESTIEEDLRSASR